MPDKIIDKLLDAVFILAFICFVVSAVAVLAVYWQNPSMTERCVLRQQPSPTSTFLSKTTYKFHEKPQNGFLFLHGFYFRWKKQ